MLSHNLEMEVQEPSGGLSREAGVLLLLAAIQHLVLKAVAASAWDHPPHSYAVNLVSELGNRVPGDVFDVLLQDDRTSYGTAGGIPERAAAHGPRVGKIQTKV